ncbi:protein transport protein BOS1 [Plasmodium brasilianum]|uniref:SNARE protein, putative n=2 Tax=Plasmodium (Plasmodium) TaxID=418103 RepID=A0A1D3PCC4_PLAMA|nr:SNARE protein, putative [Plasmodium malariae]KAI4838238.1 protein transport protein BOS1 [Plasmodium brasilianum]SCN12635.1 SNARE protein, putative [Plasmodium malariae]
MKSKYEAVLDDEMRGTFSGARKEYEYNEGSSKNNTQQHETSLNNIYGKIVKVRKELERSYNLFYSYNLIVSNNQEDNNNIYNSYSNIYKRNDVLNINKNGKNNLTLNKINALTNSFYMNVENLKNTYSFISTNNMNNRIVNNENVIWERRIETLTNEANSYIKTLDSIYKNNLIQSERNNNSNNIYNKTHRNMKKKKYDNDSTINYLHNEKEILKQVENNINIFHIQGMSTLDMLRKQNKFLKNVRKKVIDMYNYIGLSSSLVDTIKKTHKQNLIIVIVGIVLSLLFFYLLYSYFKK